MKNTGVLHDGNNPYHTAISINRFLTIENIPIAFQTTYLPDSSPCAVFLFSQLKIYIKESHLGH